MGEETSPSKNMNFCHHYAISELELTRLAWTRQELNKNLMTRYGVRSRQLLSDSDFADCVAWLKSLP